MEKKIEKKFKFYIIFIILAFIALITYCYFTIKNITTIKDNIPKILELIFILLLIICIYVMGRKNENKKNIPIIIGSIIIIIYCIINSLISLGIINLQHDEFVPNFYNLDKEKVYNWNNNYKVKITENYEYSDIIKEGMIISQNYTYPTLSKDVDELIITISLGPDYSKEINIKSLVGLKYDDALQYIKDNHLSNVTFKYVKMDNNIDTIISQSASGTMKRDDEIILELAINQEFIPFTIEDLTNKDKIYAESYLRKNGMNVKLEYDYSDTVLKDCVITQDLKGKVEEEGIVTLTISKGKKLIAPNISEMKKDDIENWISDNDLKIKYIEEYSDTINLGDIISTSTNEGDILSNSDEIVITISKGPLKMIEVDDLSNFINWAKNNDVDYQIDYEYHNTLAKDKIISVSKKTGEAISKNDVVIIKVSKGKSITIPNFVGMTKSEISKKCSSIKLNCSFKNGGLTSNTKKDICLSQSKKSGTTVSEGTNLVLTLSGGIQEKVSLPNFIGMTKTDISNKCKSIGITCSFTYESNFSSTKKDICTKQSKIGTINKGSKITITLSKGPAGTCKIIVDANQLSSGNPEGTKKTLQTKLKNNCPNVNFEFQFKTANSGIGYLAPNSDIKVGSNSLIEGKTYKVIINSN